MIPWGRDKRLSVDVPEVSSESTMSEAEKRYHESNQWGR